MCKIDHEKYFAYTHRCLIVLNIERIIDRDREVFYHIKVNRDEANAKKKKVSRKIL